MQYAVMQASLEKPGIEALKRAFHVIDSLTDYDAYSIANDAYGILLKDLSPGKASALQSALGSEGVESEIVPHNDLPALPNAKIVRRIDCLPEHLLVYDSLNRSFPVEWKHVMMIAAGSVQLSQWKRKITSQTVKHYGGFGPYSNPVPVVQNNYSTVEERKNTFVIEIVLTNAVLRYSIQENHLLYYYLAGRAPKGKLEKFGRVIQDLTKYAPKAAINRGAFHFREESEEVFSYPSKNAFYEEIVWLLWRLRRAGKW